MEPQWCPICTKEQLVLTCEQNAGACQSCQQRAHMVGVELHELCTGCQGAKGQEGPDQRILCGPCRNERDTCRGEDWPGLDVDEARDDQPALRLIA